MRVGYAIIWTTLLMLVQACHYTYTLKPEHAAKSIDYATALPDSGLANMVLPYKTALDSTMNEVVGYVDEDMEKAFPEGKLGNFVADLLYARALETNSDTLTPFNSFCLVNNGGLRVPLYKGEVTRGRVFELMPFENILTVVELDGRYVVNSLAAYIAEKKGQPVSSNVQMVFKQNKLHSITVNGEPVDTTRSYFVVTSDYLALGGDNMTFFKKHISQQEYKNLKLRDCIIACLQRQRLLQQPVAGRITGRIKFE